MCKKGDGRHRKGMKRCFLLTLLIFFNAQGQSLPQEAYYGCYKSYGRTTQLPKRWLAARSIALFDRLPPDEPWQAYAHRLQAGLSTLGIDVVGYGVGKDIFANNIVYRQLLLGLKKRQITYVIWISVDDSMQIQLEVGRVGQGDAFMVADSVYHRSAENIPKLIYLLKQDIIAQQVRSENFLVIEYAEFLPFPTLIAHDGYLSEAPIDLYENRLAVGQYYGACIEWTTQQNHTLSAWFRDNYNYWYEFADYQGDLNNLYQLGYAYVLVPLYGSPYRLHQLLGLPETSENTERYGFYLIHTYSKRAYILSPFRPTIKESLQALLKILPPPPKEEPKPSSPSSPPAPSAPPSKP